ncbi:hypothetical protein FPQ18DRAFT_312962 [Pyronema domesticum]|uniref:Similar to eRF1 methyltransferase catalytic subunit MTQ2 acc. no. Q03920 n=1 Tax=Pyronema omphalodes (strain CBS 100304) TaxID=1076935 RepID=U4LKL0_PYROM|nr:hypothetical protein FPQ18DRAFT_312962 [Pyronema domesticum]CCX32644.1 Similar to eRF1 methyltransferase catalytic subunit MTQ2; acc. no. Q03920 [Pyronema omphalodes CBS 100304]
MLPTPDTSHIDPDTTYEPNTDSYLILDSLTADAPFLSSRFKAPAPTPLILELGTGSGIISAFIASNPVTLFGRPDLLLLGTDANSIACAATNQSLKITPNPHLQLASVTADLATPIRPNEVDVLVFNPPYVPSPDVPKLGKHEDGYEEQFRLLALACDGGADGMEVTRRVFEGLGETLSARGVAYILFCASNKPDEVMEELQGKGWSCVKVGDLGKKGGIEKLTVWRIYK